MKSKILSFFSILCAVFAFFSFAYFYPRYLLSVFGPSHFLSSYLYIYTFGFFFFVMILWLLVQSGAIQLKRVGEKKWLAVFVICLLFNILMHGLWIYLAIHFPLKIA